MLSYVKEIPCKVGIHSWQHCKCRQCGKIRYDKHVWKGCTCTHCRTTRDIEHLWKGCRCSQCGKTRDTGHTVTGVHCTICGGLNYVGKQVMKICSGNYSERNEALNRLIKQKEGERNTASQYIMKHIFNKVRGNPHMERREFEDTIQDTLINLCKLLKANGASSIENLIEIYRELAKCDNANYALIGITILNIPQGIEKFKELCTPFEVKKMFLRVRRYGKRNATLYRILGENPDEEIIRLFIDDLQYIQEAEQLEIVKDALIQKAVKSRPLLEKALKVPISDNPKYNEGQSLRREHIRDVLAVINKGS